MLSDSARFYVVPVTKEVHGQVGLVVVFRQFERSIYQDHPEDLPAGWVPLDDEAQVTVWVQQMNEHLTGLLEKKRTTTP